MKFSYIAINKEGQKYTGLMEAANKGEFYHEFRKLGETLISCQEAKKSVGLNMNINISFLERIKMLDKIVFARNVGNMIEAGLSLSRAINVMERQTKNTKLKKVYHDLNEDIAAGKSFHEALEAHPNVFSNLFVAMVRVGEEGGNLAATLKQVSEQLEKSYELKKKIKSAMIYPSIILCVMFLIGILMMIFVVPSLTKTFTDMKVELPTSTKIIIAVSNFAASHYIILFMMIFAVVVGFIYASRTKPGAKAIDFVSLRLPIISSIVRESNSAQTARTLSSLLVSGVDLLLAVKICGDVLQNSYYKEVMKKGEAVVEKGEALSTVFVERENLYPIFLGEMMSVGEETGRLAPMLLGVAVFFETEVEQKTKDLSTVIEPFLMVFIGVSVGFFAVSIIKPIYSIVNNI